MYVIKYIIVNDCFVICVGSSLLSKTVDVTGIQYRKEKKEDVTGFIPKLIARPEYGTSRHVTVKFTSQILIYSNTTTLFERLRPENI